MRKLSWMMVVLIAPCAACDDDKGNRSAADASADTGPDIAPPDPLDAGNTPSQCEQEVPSFPAYEGDLYWTYEDYMRCYSVCDPNSFEEQEEFEACVAQNCPRGENEFWACVFDTFDACISSPGGSCRTAWSSVACCELDTCRNRPATCFDAMCNDELDAWVGCANEAFLSDEEPCWESRQLFDCWVPSSPAADAGPRDAGTDAGSESNDAGMDTGSDDASGDVGTDADSDEEPNDGSGGAAMTSDPPQPSLRVLKSAPTKLNRATLRKAMRHLR